MTDLGDNNSVNPLEEKKAVLTERLQKRDDDRRDNLIKRKEEKESAAAEGENVRLFYENFQSQKNSLTTRLTEASSLPPSKVADHLGALARDLDKLKKYVNDATIYLPSFDLQKSQSTLVELQGDLQKAQDELVPKKKFAFKSRSKTGQKDQPKEDSSDQSSSSLKKFNIEVNEICIKDKTNETFKFLEADVSDKDIVLSNLKGCTILLEGVGSSMQIDKLRECRIVCGPVSRSIFINNCDSSTFVLACQQLRVHHTSGCQFYLHVTTRAIIEDTTNVKFGQYYRNYSKFNEHWEKSGLNKKKNNWNDIDDFNYLASDSKSPNWTLVTAEEQAAMEASLNQ